MKKLIVFIFILCTMVGCNEFSKKSSFQENTTEISGTDTLAIVKRINQYKLQIDSIKPSLDSLQRDIYKSAEGGTIKTFHNQSDTLKKEVVYYGETGKRFLNIYLREQEPILIKDVTINYQEPINLSKNVEIRNKINNIYYFDDRLNLLYWIKNDSVMPSSKYFIQEKNIAIE